MTRGFESRGVHEGETMSKAAMMIPCRVCETCGVSKPYASPYYYQSKTRDYKSCAECFRKKNKEDRRRRGLTLPPRTENGITVGEQWQFEGVTYEVVGFTSHGKRRTVMCKYRRKIRCVGAKMFINSATRVDATA